MEIRPLPCPSVPDHDLLQVIGRGSYGEVWLARNVMGTYRAVKVVHREAFRDSAPFEREYRGIQTFEPVSRSQSGLVDVLQIGRSNGSFYYVMEVADDVETGQAIDPKRYTPKTLRSELGARGRLPVERCLDIGLALAQALGHLHRAGLVHRDVKPSNIIFVHGQPKLADIGLVSEYSEARSFVGTEGFIPPEGPGSPQADLFGLGKLLYEAATGNDRNQFPVLPRNALVGPNSETGLHELNTIILRACEDLPAHRYATAEAMREDLLVVRSGRSVRRARLLERRLTFALRLALASTILTIVAVGLSVWFRKLTQKERENVARLEAAEAETREHLWSSLLAQARARSRSGVPGHRLETLVAVRQAARIRPSPELRNEAIAALALSDLGPPRFGRDTPWTNSHPQELATTFDAGLDRVALMAQDSSIHVLRVADQTLLHLMPPLARGAEAGARLVFSPDGQYLAARYGTGEIRCWHLESTSLQVATRRRANLHYSLAFTDDSRWLLAGAQDRELHAFTLSPVSTDGRTNAPLTEPTRISRLELQPERLVPDGQGRRLIITDESVVQVLSWPGLEPLSRRDPDSLALAFAWHPDGRLLWTGAGSDVQAWIPGEGHRGRRLRGHEGPVDTMSLHPRGDLLATVAWDGTSRLWDTASTTPLLTTEDGIALQFSRDGDALGFRHATRRFGIWPVVVGRVFRSIPLADPPINHASLDFSRDGDKLIWADPSGLWSVNLRNGSLEQHPTPGWVQARFSSDSSSVILAGEKGLWRWRLRTDGLSGDASGLEWSSDPEPIGTNRFPLSMTWPMTVGADRAKSIAIEGRSPSLPRRVLILDENGPEKILKSPERTPVYSAALSPDGRWLALGHYIGPTCVVDVQSGATVRTWPELQLAGVGFTPDGRWMVTGTGEEYRFWRTETWEPGLGVPRHIGTLDPARMAFSNQGGLMAILKGFRTVTLLDWETGQILAEMVPPRPQIVRTFGFSPDGTLLAVIGQHAVHLWDLRELRRELAELQLDWSTAPYPPSPRSLGDLVFRFTKLPQRRE